MVIISELNKHSFELVIIGDLKYEMFTISVADPGFPRVGASTPKVGLKSYYLVIYFPEECMKTRMHSSRMRTVRCSGHPEGESVCLGREGVCLVGCLPSGVSAHGWCLPRGGCLSREISLGVISV